MTLLSCSYHGDYRRTDHRIIEGRVIRDAKRCPIARVGLVPILRTTKTGQRYRVYAVRMAEVLRLHHDNRPTGERLRKVLVSRGILARRRSLLHVPRRTRWRALRTVQVTITSAITGDGELTVDLSKCRKPSSRGWHCSGSSEAASDCPPAINAAYPPSYQGKSDRATFSSALRPRTDEPAET